MGKAKSIDHVLIEKAGVNYKYTGMFGIWVQLTV